MRLKTLNSSLAAQFETVRGGAAAKFESVFWFCFDKLDPLTLDEIGKSAELDCLLRRQLPNVAGRADLVDALDECYFDAEDDGDDEKAGLYFKLARIAAALVMWANSKSNEEYAEAAYEALMSGDDPEKTAKQYIEQA
ncbi:hypothetical protein [Aliiroseovarius crassostreae]|uniref:hypothetical protein n=1 Tax=Aliiroseovarius crassostreae TaxID=154981 RepID=UPI003C7A2CDA